MPVLLSPWQRNRTAGLCCSRAAVSSAVLKVLPAGTFSSITSPEEIITSDTRLSLLLSSFNHACRQGHRSCLHVCRRYRHTQAASVESCCCRTNRDEESTNMLTACCKHTADPDTLNNIVVWRAHNQAEGTAAYRRNELRGLLRVHPRFLRFQR